VPSVHGDFSIAQLCINILASRRTIIFNHHSRIFGCLAFVQYNWKKRISGILPRHFKVPLLSNLSTRLLARILHLLVLFGTFRLELFVSCMLHALDHLICTLSIWLDRKSCIGWRSASIMTGIIMIRGISRYRICAVRDYWHMQKMKWPAQQIWCP
jgi:hypothetical protein